LVGVTCFRCALGLAALFRCVLDLVFFLEVALMPDVHLILF